MRTLLGLLAARARQKPARPIWVVVRSHALGHTLGERLAREQASWVNVRFKTPFDLALECAGPELVARGVDPMPTDLGPGLVMRLLLELPDDTPRYFRPLARHATMADALWRSVTELRLAGVRASTLPADAFAVPAKHAELRALLAAYEHHLESRAVADAALIFDAAASAIGTVVRSGDLWLEAETHPWAPAIARFLEAAPAERIRATARDPEAPAPRRVRVHADVIAEGTPPPCTDWAGVRVFAGGSRDGEVDEVFRQLVAAGTPIDDVEIACGATDAELLVWQRAQRLGWPVTLGAGLPATFTRPARAALAWLAWIEQGYPATLLRALLVSADVRLDGDGVPPPARASRLLARAGSTWGRATYGATLRALAAHERRRAAEEGEDARERRESRARDALALAGWIDALLDLVPCDDAPDGGQVDLTRMVGGVRAFLARVARVAGELDAASRTALDSAVADLEHVGRSTWPLCDAIRLVRSACEDLRLVPDRARPGSLHVTKLPRAGESGRAHVFLVGLEEGQVIHRAHEDPVLLDAERARIDPSLATAADRVDESVARLAEAIGRARENTVHGTLSLSYAARDIRQYRGTWPAAVLTGAARTALPEGLRYDAAALERHIGVPVSVVPSRDAPALDECRAWFRRAREAGEGAAAAIRLRYPALAAGREAARQRDSDAFTRFDGLVVSAGPVLDPRRSARPASTTGLETFASCPFRYFLENGLGVDGDEDRTRAEDVWLDALTRGSLLHALFARLLRRARDEHRWEDLASLETWWIGEADAELARLREAMPPPSDLVFERERDVLVRELSIFVSLEAARAREVAPYALEVGFGRSGGSCEDDDEPLRQGEPVTLRVGDVEFRLSGRIDRIDRRQDGTYRVIDYKTGGFYRPSFTGVVRGGRLLQHALYGRAAERLLTVVERDPRVSEAGYYFPCVRGEGELLLRPRVEDRELAPVLARLFDAMAQGAFVHTPEKGDCGLCELGRACGRARDDEEDGSIAQAKRKLQNVDNRELSHFKALRIHE